MNPNFRKFTPKSGGNGTSFDYLVDDIDLFPRDFIYLYNFESNELKYIAYQDLEKNWSEVHHLVDEENPAILLNGIRTPDGTEIYSYHRHDFVTHIDTVNQKMYSVDGGLDYLRRVGDDGSTELSLFETSPFMELRQKIKWGTRGKNGDEPLRFIPIEEMTDEHLLAVIETQKKAHPQFLVLMKNEYIYRIRTGKVNDKLGRSQETTT